MAKINKDKAVDGTSGWVHGVNGPVRVVKTSMWLEFGNEHGYAISNSRPVFETEGEAATGQARRKKKTKVTKKTGRTHSEMSVVDDD